MQRRILPQQLGPDARIVDLARRHAGPLVGGDVADAVAAGLNAVHADGGKVGHRIGQVGQLDPVELDVLPRREVAVAAVIFARDMRQHAHLRRRQRAVGNGDAQHVGMQLQIDAVHQAQRLELVLGQLAGKAALHLIAEFIDAFLQQRAVEFVVCCTCKVTLGGRGSAKVVPRRRMFSRKLPGSIAPLAPTSTGAM